MPLYLPKYASNKLEEELDGVLLLPPVIELVELELPLLLPLDLSSSLPEIPILAALLKKFVCISTVLEAFPHSLKSSVCLSNMTRSTVF